MLPFVFDDGFGFERYTDYMLDVPMYFVYRDGNYIDASGQSFRDFMAGNLPALPGELPTMKDWEDHLTTAFPEVRLKKFIEMRGADGGPWGRLCALSAFWVGLMYDDNSLDAAWDLVKDWSLEELESLRADVPKTALQTSFRSGTLQDIALQVLEMSRAGLQARARLDSSGLDETIYLKLLHVTAKSGLSPAEEMLAKFDGDWQGSTDPVYTEYCY